MENNTTEMDVAIAKRYRELYEEIDLLFTEKHNLLAMRDTMPADEFRKKLSKIEDSIDFAYMGLN